MVIYGCCLNNVLINSVKFNKKTDFETLLRKNCSLNSESKSQVICGCENVSLGRTASLSVKILFNRQIFRASQFHSWGGCCFRLTSASCAYFWNKNSFPRSCSSRSALAVWADTGAGTVCHLLPFAKVRQCTFIDTHTFNTSSLNRRKYVRKHNLDQPQPCSHWNALRGRMHLPIFSRKGVRLSVVLRRVPGIFVLLMVTNYRDRG